MKKTIKKFVSTITLVLFLISTFSLLSQDTYDAYGKIREDNFHYQSGGELDGWSYEIYSDNTVRTSAECSSENSYIIMTGYKNPIQHIDDWVPVTMPNKINDIPVKVIEVGYSKSWSFKELTIPNSVTSIDSWTFSSNNAHFLEKIHIPGSVEVLPANLFNKNYYLNTVTLGEGIKKISSSAFYNSSIKSIIIPSTVKEIDDSAFSFCNQLTQVNILGSDVKIGRNVFKGCKNLSALKADNFCGSISSNSFDETPILENRNGFIIIGKCLYKFLDNGTEDINIPEGIKKINEEAFKNCEKITSLTTPNSLTSIDDYAFFNCSSLKNVSLNHGIINIGKSAFYSCIALKEINLPDSIVSIDEMSFYYCKNLTSIKLPKSLNSIGYRAFNDCLRLSEIDFSNSIHTIGDYAFAGCPITECTISTKDITIGKSAIGYTFENRDETTLGFVSTYKSNPSFVLRGYSGSGVEEYAIANGFTFIPLDSETEKIQVDSQNSNTANTSDRFGILLPIFIVTLLISPFIIYFIVIKVQRRNLIYHSK